MPLKKIIFIVGPTSVGKTALSAVLARKLKAEVISCDSMQVYKEISVVNNKPPKKLLKEVPHHLVGILSIRKDFDVAAFRKKTREVIRRIQEKSKIPLIVGGSGLYVKILLDGIFEKNAKNEGLRRTLEAEAKEKGSQVLHEQLKKVDPKAASKIHPHDTKRIIRALEVFLLTKKPISKLQKTRQGLWGNYDIRVFFLDRERDELYRRIDGRVEEMFEQGLVEEIKGLSDEKWSKTAGAMIGLKEVRGFLSGEYGLERAKELMKQNTRRYAKRQLTWFRRDERFKRIPVGEKETPKDIAEKILKHIRK